MSASVTIYRARLIRTMDPTRPEATHVAVRDGRVLGVGDRETLAGWGPHALDERFADRVLYASTSFVYRPTATVTSALAEWYLHKARYLLHDQLALPYVLWRWGVEVQPIESDIYSLPHWAYVRG